MQMEHVERSSLFRNFLKQEFLRRMRSNSQYSLRAFAKNMGASPSYVSKLFNSNKQISIEKMELFVSELGYGPEKVKELMDQSPEFVRHEQLSKDIYELTSAWYYHAILELTHLGDFPGTIDWIAKVLELSVNEVKLAVEALERLGLLKIKDGQWIDCYEFSTINYEGHATSTALKKYQTDILELSLSAVENISSDKRQHRSMIYAVDSELVPELNKEIREFILKVTQKLEKKSKKKNSLYALQISNFPIIKEIPDDNP